MSRRGRETDVRVGGLSLWAKFVLSTSVALVVVMTVGGFLLYGAARRVADAHRSETLVEAVELTGRLGHGRVEQVSGEARQMSQSGVRRFDVTAGEGADRRRLWLYQYPSDAGGGGGARLLVPQNEGEAGESLLGIIVGVTFFVLLAGVVVSYAVANQVSKPLASIIDDVRQIANGNLAHRIRVQGGGEVAHLARAIGRMTDSLLEAQDAQVELGVREREIEVAAEVREALLPQSTPEVPGYQLGALHVGSPQPGGDFHDFVELEDGRVRMLVCGVSGEGVPGALVGATARAYLRAELMRPDDMAEVLKRVNRELARDVRRGMYVTALVVTLEPGAHRASVACAGHKVPLVRFTAADGKVRTVHPEGIALAFDKGPVFDRTLAAQELELAPGDRLVLANEGALRVEDPDGNELGEKAFYRAVLRGAAGPTRALLDSLERTFEQHAADAEFPNDISIVSVSREA